MDLNFDIRSIRKASSASGVEIQCLSFMSRLFAVSLVHVLQSLSFTSLFPGELSWGFIESIFHRCASQVNVKWDLDWPVGSRNQGSV
jgi:hypothetical protein